MLSLLAVYKDFPEETAARLLSNDMLIDRLRSVENDELFQEQVELAIASENQALLEERAALVRQVESLRSDKERVVKELEEQKRIAEEEATKAKETIKAIERESKELADAKQNAEEKAKDALAKLTDIETTKASMERKTNRYAIVVAVCVSVLLIAGFEALVHNLPWMWLKNHPNSYSLQAGICGVILSFIIGLFLPRWRKVWWLTILIAMVVAVIALLGGPNSTGMSTTGH